MKIQLDAQGHVAQLARTSSLHQKVAGSISPQGNVPGLQV